MNEFLYLLWKQRQMYFKWFNKTDKTDEKLYILEKIDEIEKDYRRYCNDYNEIESII